MTAFSSQRRAVLKMAGGSFFGGILTSEAGGAETKDSNQLVGAHYYPWWGKPPHWDSGYFGTPTLGEYSSRDVDIIQTHIDWLVNNGVTWLSLSWWGRDSWEDQTIQEYILKHEAISNVSFSILYEPRGTLKYDPDSDSVDFDDPENQRRFIEDMKYLSETYFSHDSHLRFDGRPVVYLYIVKAFEGDFAGILETLRTEHGINPYIIGDIFQWFSPGVRDLSIARELDAFTAYSLFDPKSADINQGFLGNVEALLEEWRLAAEYDGVDFIPPAMPGKHDGENPEQVILERTPERFRGFLSTALEFADSPSNAVLINSFNEWHEGTQIEPGTDYDMAYLEEIPGAVSQSESRATGFDSYSLLELEYDQTVSEYKLNPDVSKEDSRELAFWCSQLTLRGPDQTVVARYVIGSPTEEPVLLEGAYHVNPQNRTTRWFGGPTKKTAIALKKSRVEEAVEVSLTGMAAKDRMRMRASIDGTPIGENKIDRDSWKTYSYSYGDRTSTTAKQSTTISTGLRNKTTVPVQSPTLVDSPTTSTTSATVSGFGLISAITGVISAFAIFHNDEDDSN